MKNDLFFLRSFFIPIKRSFIDIIINANRNFMIYLFKSSNLNDPSKFINDFNENDIAFIIESLQTLEIILNSNSLESYSNDSDDIDRLFPLDEN